MKSLLSTITLVAFPVLAGHAQDAQKSEPEKLVNLRMSWQRSVSQATAPLDKKYRESLVKMKADFTRAGNLDGALAVDAEIKQLDSSEDKMASKPRPKAADEVIGNWRLTYAGGWVYNREVFENGTWRDWKTPTFDIKGYTWKVDGERIEFKFPDGATEWFDPKLAKGANMHGTIFTGVRVQSQ